MIRKITISFLIFFKCICFALELSPEDSLVLEKFFHALFEKYEGGYVFYDKKPVCIPGFRRRDFFSEECDKHKELVILREGAYKWKNLKLNCVNQNFIVHTYDNADIFVTEWIHILLINKKLFLDTVRSNLSLFQYVLGPDVTPDSLFNRLTDPKESFHAVLKNDRVLIGILLGFGVQNSLYVSRIEKIEASLFSPEEPPFNSQLLMLEDLNPGFFQKFLLTDFCGENISFAKEEPSFGYSSLKEEAKSLQDKLQISSFALAEELPPFVFGRLKGDQETQSVVDELEETQVKIRQLLSSPTFLNDILEKILTGETPVIHKETENQLFFSESEAKQIPSLAAANIYEIIKREQKQGCLESFIAGMKDADANAHQQKEGSKTGLYYDFRTLSKIVNNIKDADDYFFKLSKNSTCTPIAPFKLYYKTTQQGAGDCLLNQENVRMRYVIQTPAGEVVANHWATGQPKLLNLSKTIPGFSWGVRGMRVGETREIYIHPSLAYGIYTTFEKGVYLKAVVQLVSIEQEQVATPFQEPVFLNLTIDMSPFADLNDEEEAKNSAYETGYRLWQHYKKSGFYTICQIIEQINLMQTESHVDLDSQTNQNLINRLHWNIYADYN